MTVYILDDDRVELALWYQNLIRLMPGSKFYLFTDAFDFMRSASAYPPDIAVIDFVLNLQSGVDVCKWLHEFHPKAKIYANTGLVGDEYQVLADRCFATYLCKNTELCERVEVVANGCRS